MSILTVQPERKWGARRRLRAPGRTTTGAAVAEVAAVMPILVVTVVALAWMLSLAATHVRVVDAAREAARVAARADSAADAEAAARRVAPEGADVRIEQTDTEVVVRVQVTVDGPGGIWSGLPGAVVSATAVMQREGG